LIKFARETGYEITSLFLWLDSPKLAKQRVAERVSKGGHNIPAHVIERRFYRGIQNLFALYMPVCDKWIVIDNRNVSPEILASGKKNKESTIKNIEIWKTILVQSKHEK
jgi:predicted ABC-type ATPase